MGIAEGIIVYCMAWWIVFYMALPWGVRTPDHPVPGQERSAPQHPYLGRKIFITSLMAFLIVFIVDAALKYFFEINK